MVQQSLKYENGGYIALISAAIMSVILVGMAFMANMSGYFARFGSLNGEYKRISKGLAESCVNAALFKIADDYNYQTTTDPGPHSADGSVIIPVGRDNCFIKKISYSPEIDNRKTATIETIGSYEGAFSKMSITSTVQNPNAAPEATITLRVSVDGGAKSVADFSNWQIGSREIKIDELGEPIVFEPGMYSAIGEYINNGNVSDPDYNTIYGGDCSSGSLTLGEHGTATCVIMHNYIAQPATVTAIVNVKNNRQSDIKAPADFPLSIDIGSGQALTAGIPLTIQKSDFGLHEITAVGLPGYSTSGWGTDCASDGSITVGAGENKICTITYTQDLPPAPDCADTVMMIDRTGSMTGWPDYPSGCDQWLPNVSAAAKGLLDLYTEVSPTPTSAPNVGLGLLGGDIDDSLAQIVDVLTNSKEPAPYGNHDLNNPNNDSGLYRDINNGLTAFHATWSGTNLASAIDEAAKELNSTRHADSNKKKLLILFSDGDPNLPNGNVSQPALISMPTADEPNNDSADKWINPAGAYGPGEAYDDAGHSHIYKNFGFGNLAGAGLPLNATIDGMEIQTDARSSVGAVPIFNETFGSVDSAFVNGWVQPSGASRTMIAGIGAGGSPAEDITRDGNASNKFVKIGSGEWICQKINIASYQSLSLHYYRNGDANYRDTSDRGYVEYKTSGNCSDGSGWTRIERPYLDSTNWSSLQSYDFPVLPNNTNLLIRFRNVSSRSAVHFRIDDVTLVAAQFGIQLSWDGGSHWTVEKTQFLGNYDAEYLFNGSWGSHTWRPADFSDTNFRVRIRNLIPGQTCYVDNLRAAVSYSLPRAEADALSAANSAKSNGGIYNTTDTKPIIIYTIHFGDAGGEDFLKKLANSDGHFYSVSSAESGTIKDIFEDIGRRECSSESGSEMSPAPPLLTIITHVSGGTLTAASFNATVTSAALDGSPKDYGGNELGEPVTFKSGSHNVSYSIVEPIPAEGYTQSHSPDCEGTISDGDNKTCIFFNSGNLQQSQTSSQSQNIDINSWVEK